MVPGQARLTIASLQEVDAAVSRDLSNVAEVAASLSQLKSEIDTRIGEDINLLKASPFLDLLYQLQSTWQNFSGDLSELDRKLAERATNLEAEHSRVDQLSETWQATLQSATPPDTPQSVLHNAQTTIDSIGHTRQKIDSGRIQLLTVQGDLSEQEARVATTLASVEQAQDQALKSLLLRDGSPLWDAGTSLASEWAQQSGASFSAQWHASMAFVQRYNFVFLALPLLIALIAGALQLMRRKLRRVLEEKPDLQRALPILELPVSMALVLSLLTVLSVCPQAPRFILAILGGIALVPTVLILRKLLFPSLAACRHNLFLP